MKYTIGLDIGTSSVGWAVVNNDIGRIEDLGVRLFDSAENQKDGESLATPRREARGMRRRIDRRGYRLGHLKSIFEKNGLLTKQEMTDAHKTHTEENSPYKLRSEALDRLLTNEELFIAVYHIAKRRGYKSNRKHIAEEVEGEKNPQVQEGKVVLENAERNKKLLKQGNYRTVGEMLYKCPEFSSEKRNKAGSYKHCVLREMLEDELKLILDKQRQFGNSSLTDTFILQLIGRDEKGKDIGVFNFQRPFASGEQIKKLVGKCSFEKDEMRAAKATYSFQYFNILQRLNQLTIKNRDNGTERKLSSDERKQVLAKAFEVKEVTYASLRKLLSLAAGDRFNMVSYAVRQKDLAEKTEEELIRAIEKKAKFPSMKEYLSLKNILSVDESFWNEIRGDMIYVDAIAETLTLHKTDEDIVAHLHTISIERGHPAPSDIVMGKLLMLSFTKFGHLSLKALRKIIPFLEEGDIYTDACMKADPAYSGRVKAQARKLPPLDVEDHSITNPVARRAIAQTIKVVNAIVDKYDSPPSEVHVELARELAKNFKERSLLAREQKRNEEKNAQVVRDIAELFDIKNPRGKDIIKYRLWKEQEGRCIYSGETIDEQRIFDDGYAEVDHIIPFSRSFNDSFANKVLVLKSKNQDKMNKTPYEYLGSDPDDWRRFENIVNSMVGIGYRKKQNLLLKKYVADDLTTRTLNDTRFISRYMKNYIEDRLLFQGDPKKQHVITVNGQATAYLRKRWGLRKVRAESDLHHAQDAVVVAVVNTSLVQRVMRYSKTGEVIEYLHAHKYDGKTKDPETNEAFGEEFCKETKESYLAMHEQKTKHLFPEPWKGFTLELEARMSDEPKERLSLQHTQINGYNVASDLSGVRPIFVSRTPRRKIGGRLHDETLRSPKNVSERKESSVRVPLQKLDLKKLEQMSGITSDQLLYGVLKKRLEDYGDDATKAFAEPVYKPRKDGTNGPLVRSVKIRSVQLSGMTLNGGRAFVDQDSMVRIDIFSKVGKKEKKEFFIIPIYAHHFSRKSLPNKYIIGGKPEEEWGVIDESYIFEFSVYPNDLLKVTKEGKSEYWYYKKCGRATASITVISHDGSREIPSMGVKTLDNIEKYVVDVLGGIHRVGKESRQGITR